MKLWSRLLEGEGGDGSSNGGGGQQTILGGAADGSSQQQAGAGDSASWSWTKEDGSFSDGWLEKLGPELATSASLKSVGNLSDLAKNYHATKAMVGKKLEMPASDAPPEAWQAWRKVTGAPEKPEGYRGDAKSLRPDALPEDGWSMETEGKFLAIAHKHGLPPTAVKEIMGLYGEVIVDGLNQSQGDESAMIKAETTKLQQKWGQDFDARLSDASRMAKLAGLDPATNPIFTRSEVVEGFATLAKLIAGDTAVKGEQQGLGASIGERVKDISDPKSASMMAREYRGEFGPERQSAAQATLHQLMASLAPAK